MSDKMSDKVTDCCNVNKNFSAKEIEKSAQLKRFSEWMQADVELRTRLSKGEGLTSEQEEWLKKIGVSLDMDEISFLWKHPVEVNAYIMFAIRGRKDELNDEINEIVKKYPLLELWGKYSESRCAFTQILEQWANVQSVHEKFNAWRKRRIASAKSELGYFGMRLGHPSFSFELNSGCSVGCWFCSFATDKLSGTLDYPERRGEVLSIVRQCSEIFGKEVASMALPYYRTEPHDNPHYIDFLKDFENEMGEVLCTSTAAGHDIEWVQKLLDYYQNDRSDQIYYWPRLSILTLDMLKKVHTAFTPMQTKDIELLIQVKDAARPKITGGRILKEQAGLREVEDFSSDDRITLAASVPQGTIACVSGFNINLVTRRIMIFGPCYTSNRWPHGFRVYGEASYNDENDFPEVIRDLAERTMFLSPPKDSVLKFRDDIVFRATQDGFDLATAHQLHHFKGRNRCGPLGQLIAEGVHTYAEISEILHKEHKVNPIILRAAVQQLFDDGLIDEIYM
ncbi:MAG: radical SAM family RiPP maturation amino acid epimerase [Defluviitaleaceae bacterium]|nr:radical SAM family RiPP maturation amino acid epimerase [Defluviitaleaceae bacterium]